MLNHNKLISQSSDWDHEKTLDQLLATDGILISTDYKKRHKGTNGEIALLIPSQEDIYTVLTFNEDGVSYSGDVSPSDDVLASWKPVSPMNGLIMGAANTVKSLVNYAMDVNITNDYAFLLSVMPGMHIVNRATLEVLRVVSNTVTIDKEVDGGLSQELLVDSVLIRKPGMGDLKTVSELTENNMPKVLEVSNGSAQCYSVVDPKLSTEEVITKAKLKEFLSDLFPETYDLGGQMQGLSKLTLNVPNELDDFALFVVPAHKTSAFLLRQSRNIVLGEEEHRSSAGLTHLVQSLEHGDFYTVEPDELNTCYFMVSRYGQLYAPSGIVGSEIREVSMPGGKVMHLNVKVLPERVIVSIDNFLFPSMLAAEAYIKVLQNSSALLNAGTEQEEG